MPATHLPLGHGCACREDKVLHVMVLLKLGLIQRKVLLFINSINEGYRLRLFLEAFGIRSAVLNAELPLNSRHHILQVKLFPKTCSSHLSCVEGAVTVCDRSNLSCVQDWLHCVWTELLLSCWQSHPASGLAGGSCCRWHSGGHNDDGSSNNNNNNNNADDDNKTKISR